MSILTIVFYLQPLEREINPNNCFMSLGFTTHYLLDSRSKRQPNSSLTLCIIHRKEVFSFLYFY